MVHKKAENFTYTTDWGGFNIPVKIIRRVREAGIDDPNHYDSLMHFVMTTIDAECDDGYLIGLTKHAGAVDKHEMTHAMFHIDKVYNRESMRMCSEHMRIFDAICNHVMKNGYASTTVEDEAQTYLTTGDGFIKDVRKTDPKEYDKLKSKLTKLHKKHFAKFIKDIKT